MEVTAFEEIQKLYGKWSEDEHRYLMQSLLFARGFANGFREHVGAPQQYLELDGATTREYVEARKVDCDLSGEHKPVPEKGVDFLTRLDDGFFLFGVRFVFEPAPNAFPKQSIVYVIAFRIVEGTCEMKVAGESFSFDAREKKARAPAYDQMIAALKKELEHKPWEGVQKQAIGFLPLSRA
jgi:hypothetical protein